MPIRINIDRGKACAQAFSAICQGHTELDEFSDDDVVAALIMIAERYLDDLGDCNKYADIAGIALALGELWELRDELPKLALVKE